MHVAILVQQTVITQTIRSNKEKNKSL